MSKASGKWANRGAMLFAALAAGAVLSAYAFFICGVPLRWPYYAPRMEGAEIVDPAAWFLPRANMAPFARYSLGQEGHVIIRSTCYPLVAEDGYRHCSIGLRFDVADRTELRFADVPVSVTADDGTPLVDLEFYRRFADQMKSVRGANIVKDGQLYLTYSDFMSSASVPLNTKVGTTYTARFPNVIYKGREIILPEVSFRRVDNLTCTGFFSNF